MLLITSLWIRKIWIFLFVEILGRGWFNILSFSSIILLFSEVTLLHSESILLEWGDIPCPCPSKGTHGIGLPRITSHYIRAWAFEFEKAKQNCFNNFSWNYWVDHNIILELLKAIFATPEGKLAYAWGQLRGKWTQETEKRERDSWHWMNSLIYLCPSSTP